MDGNLSNPLYHGVVRNGVVVLAPGVSLPEGTNVTLKPEKAGPYPDHRPSDDKVQVRNGAPLFSASGGKAVTIDVVNSLRDDAE